VHVMFVVVVVVRRRRSLLLLLGLDRVANGFGSSLQDLLSFELEIRHKVVLTEKR
jgi:hypothetical protein